MMWHDLQDRITYVATAGVVTDYFTGWLALLPDLQTSVLIVTIVWFVVQIVIKIWEFWRTFK